MTRFQRAGATYFTPAGAANGRDGSIGNAFPLAGGIGLVAIRSFTRMHFMTVMKADSRDSVATFGMDREEARKSLLLRFMDALKESRRREARRVIATHAHLLANRDILGDENKY
jgi:hypothetical protein